MANYGYTCYLESKMQGTPDGVNVFDVIGDEPAELPPNGIPCDPTVNWLDLHILVHGGLFLGPAAFFIMAFKAYLDPFQMFVTTIHLMHGFHSALTMLDDQKDWFAFWHEFVR